MTDVQASEDTLESSASLGFVVVAAFVSALAWLGIMLSQLSVP
jgi:hypothetical protein